VWKNPIFYLLDLGWFLGVHIPFQMFVDVCSMVEYLPTLGAKRKICAKPCIVRLPTNHEKSTRTILGRRHLKTSMLKELHKVCDALLFWAPQIHGSFHGKYMGSPWRPWEVLCWKLLRVYHWMGYGEHNLKQREESKFILVVVVVAIDRGVQYVFYYIYIHIIYLLEL
jgi:hypothetical protein